MVVIHPVKEFLDSIKTMENYILEEVNVQKITLSSDLKAFGVQCKVTPDFQKLGERLRSQMKQVHQGFAKLSIDDIEKIQKPDAVLNVAGVDIQRDEYKLVFSLQGHENYSSHSDGEVVTLLDITKDEDSMKLFGAREVVNRIQKLRKKANLIPTDDISIICWSNDDSQKILREHLDFINENVRMPVTVSENCNSTLIIESMETVKFISIF